MNIKTKISKFDSIDCGCGDVVLLNDDLDKKYSNGIYKISKKNLKLNYKFHIAKKNYLKIRFIRSKKSFRIIITLVIGGFD